MTHVFALGQLLGRPGCGPLVEHGVAALQGRFRDHAHGGWYASVDAGGPAETTKAAYGHAFVVIAASSAAAAGHPLGRELLDDALSVLLDRFWEDGYGMVVDEWNEDFTELDPYRGVNANMHTVEALLAAADVLGDRSLLEKAQRITTRVVHDLAREHSWRIPEHFDTDWQLWVETGATPVPRTLVITRTTVSGAPQYTLRVKSWKTGVEAAPGAFTFVPPATAKRVSPDALIDLDELPQDAPRGGKR